jgi:hypothetical protein
MIDHLVHALKHVWQDVGLNLTGVEQQQQQEQPAVVLRQRA